MRQEERMSEPTKQRSVWVSVAMALLAMLVAKACVGSMVEKPRARSAYSGGR